MSECWKAADDLMRPHHGVAGGQSRRILRNDHFLGKACGDACPIKDMIPNAGGADPQASPVIWLHVGQAQIFACREARKCILQRSGLPEALQRPGERSPQTEGCQYASKGASNPLMRDMVAHSLPRKLCSSSHCTLDSKSVSCYITNRSGVGTSRQAGIRSFAMPAEGAS